MSLSPRTPLRIGTVLLLGLLFLSAASRVSAMGFSAGLSPEERDGVGISKLSASEVSALDLLVARDVSLAHEGGVSGFSTPFTARRSKQELEDCGIAKLSDKERSLLDTLAARTIAMGPPPESAFSYSPKQAPAPKTSIAGTVVSAVKGLDVHGDVSFTVGGGSHGRSFYGTSFDAFATDPTGTFTLGVGYDEYKGRGYFLPMPLLDPVDPFYLGGPWLDRGP